MVGSYDIGLEVGNDVVNMAQCTFLTDRVELLCIQSRPGCQAAFQGGKVICSDVGVLADMVVCERLVTHCFEVTCGSEAATTLLPKLHGDDERGFGRTPSPLGSDLGCADVGIIELDFIRKRVEDTPIRPSRSVSFEACSRLSCSSRRAHIGAGERKCHACHGQRETLRGTTSSMAHAYVP